MKKFLNIIFILIIIFYPFIIFFSLNNFEPRILSLFLLAVISIRFLQTKQSKNNKNNLLLFQKYGVLIGGITLVILIQIYNQDIFIKLYPVLMNLIFFFSFSYTLLSPPSMIERFARIQNKNPSKHLKKYTYKVTIAWCLLFLFNTIMSVYTAIYTDLKTWTLYNGFISYLLIGTLFFGEFIIRYFVKKKNNK